MVDEVGIEFLTCSVVMVKEFKARVSRIMLAKPMVIVIIIPRETRPPVSVLY